MATQRITIAKIGGQAAAVVMKRCDAWAAARQSSAPDEWYAEQWPPDVRDQVDSFVVELRGHALEPPVVYFVEWADLWSMHNLFRHWLAPPGQPPPLVPCSGRFDVYAYRLPDDGRLEQHLMSARRQQCDESKSFVARLREALVAWNGLIDRGALIVVREVVGGLVTDEEIQASLNVVPDWLARYVAKPAEG